MLSRRDVLKLVLLGHWHGIDPSGSSTSRSFLMKKALVEESSRQLNNANGPRLDQPIAIKWQADEVAWSWYDGSVNESLLIVHHYSRVVAVERTTGVARWEFNIPPIDDIDAQILSSEISTHHVFVVSLQGSTQQLHSLDLYSGKELWTFHLNELWDYDLNYLAQHVSNDNTLFAWGLDTGLVGLDIISGQVSWLPTSPIMAMPVYLQGRRLVAWTKGGFCVFDLDSRIMLWEVGATDFDENFVDFPYPILIDDQYLYITQDEYSIESISIDDGSELWSFQSSGQLLPQALTGDLLFILSDDGYAYCLDRNTGDVIWRWGPTDSSWRLSGYDRRVNPSNIVGEMFYALTRVGMALALEKHTGIERWRREMGYRPQLSGDTIYSLEYEDGSDSYAISCIDALSGDTIWKHEFEGFNWESPGDPIIDNGDIFLGGYPAIAIGNVLPPTLATSTELKAAPFTSALTRRAANAGDVLDAVGARENQDGITWVEVTIGVDTGWIPIETIDQATLPPEGGWEIIYQP